ncbi:MAG: CHRD domain-containing protein [Gemmatimonadaceae bacterium]
MRRLALFLVLPLAACGDEIATSPAADPALAPVPQTAVATGHHESYNTQLRPENENRFEPVTDPVESVARGHAQIKLYDDNTIEFKIKVHNPARETFVAGHIHRGGEDVNGPVVVSLFPPGFGSSDKHFDLRGSTTASPVLADEIRANPAGFYVNLHTTQDPQGAIRGQLP